MGVTTSAAATGALERVRFYPRQLLEAEDLRQEQAYHRERARRHNRYLHGWGLVHGCAIRAAPVTNRPWQVRVCPGYLLTPQGDEVSVPVATDLDIADCTLSTGDPCAFARPCPPISRRALVDRTVYLALRYVECEAHPVRHPGSRCSCCDGEVHCEYGRIRDGYELCCLSTLPDSHQEAGPQCEDLCTGVVLEPPTATPEPWVVLATIRLPEQGTAITVADIDELTHRRLLYPSAAVQALARCNCAGA